jgi:SAM-dependent methyltransferase
LWLANRGLDVWGVDISGVAIAAARELAARQGLVGRCRFDVIDLDNGLPDGPPVDVLHCHLFRDARLDSPIVDRLAPGGLLAIAVLSPVGGSEGPYRTSLDELLGCFRALAVVESGESEGKAWLLGRK